MSKLPTLKKKNIFLYFNHRLVYNDMAEIYENQLRKEFIICFHLMK